MFLWLWFLKSYYFFLLQNWSLICPHHLSLDSDSIYSRAKTVEDGEVCKCRQVELYHWVQWVPHDDEQAGGGGDEHGVSNGGI